MYWYLTFCEGLSDVDAVLNDGASNDSKTGEAVSCEIVIGVSFVPRVASDSSSQANISDFCQDLINLRQNL